MKPKEVKDLAVYFLNPENGNEIMRIGFFGILISTGIVAYGYLIRFIN